MQDFETTNPLTGRLSDANPAAPTPSTPASLLTIVRLNELFDRWINFANVCPKSVEIYTSATRMFLRWLQECGIANPRREDILTYKQHLEATNKKPTTIKLYIIAVRQFFKWLEAENVYKNVVQHVKVPKIDLSHKKDHLTSEQVKAVLNNIKRRTETGLRDYAILLLMVTCGLRRVEICRANVEDLQAVGDSTRLYIQGKGKTDKTDYVNVLPPVELAIREYITERNMRLRYPAVPLFTSISNNNYGGRLSVRCVTGIAKERLLAAGYDSDRLCAHSLRHTAVTLALLAGQPLQEVQQFARHTSIITTVAYAHNIDKKNKENNNCAQAVAGTIL